VSEETGGATTSQSRPAESRPSESRPAEAKRPRPVPMSATVARVEWLSPTMVRIVVGGPELERFVARDETDAYVKVLFLHPDGDYPRPIDVDAIRASMPPELWPRQRSYTVRGWDPVAGD
jgi:NADPH-dependent ferric siderophore reductase